MDSKEFKGITTAFKRGKMIYDKYKMYCNEFKMALTIIIIRFKVWKTILKDISMNIKDTITGFKDTITA